MTATGDTPNETVTLAAVLAKNAVKRQGELRKELSDAYAQIERLRTFIGIFSDANLDDMAADAITVGMVLQKRAKELLKS